MKREAKEIYPTLKITPKPDDEFGVKFEKDMQISIQKVENVSTNAYGEKVVAIVVDSKDSKVYGVFVNNASMKNLIKAFGEDDELWKGKICNLKKEKDKKFNNEMIVFYPVK